MASFGLICEGHTDQIVLEHILYGYFEEEPDINPLVPLRDETDQSQIEYGGWYQVLEYCKDQKLKDALQFQDFLIIQIDTDVSEEPHFDVSHTDDKNKELSVEVLVTNVQKKIVSLMGEDFYEGHKSQIIFAIAVHSIECWLLPPHVDKKKSSKTKNCLTTLNQAANKKFQFTIAKNNKDSKYYETLARPYEKGKKKDIKKYYERNESLHIFMQALKEQASET